MTSAPDGPDWRSRAIHVLAYVATQTDERLAGRGPLEAGPIDSPEHVAATRAVRFCLELAGAEEGWWKALVEGESGGYCGARIFDRPKGTGLRSPRAEPHTSRRARIPNR